MLRIGATWTVAGVLGITSGVCQPTFRYNGFALNTKVTFNDVVNSLGDRSLVITEPSVYQVGEDIVYKGDNGTKVTLGFFEGTQNLQTIRVDDLYNQGNNLKSFLRDYLVLGQLGQPVKGYDMRIVDSTGTSTKESFRLEYVHNYNETHYFHTLCEGVKAGSHNGVTDISYTFEIGLWKYPPEGTGYLLTPFGMDKKDIVRKEYQGNSRTFIIEKRY